MSRRFLWAMTAWAGAVSMAHAVEMTWSQTNGPFGGFVFAVHASSDASGDGPVYAGTGSGVLFRSDDGGASWEIVNAAVATGDLLVLASFDDALYGGTDGDGVLRSYDQG